VSDNVSSVVKAFQFSLPKFILHKTSNKGIGEDKQLLPEFVSQQDFVENGRFKLSDLPERVSCFAHTKLYIKDCLQDAEF